MSGIQTHDFNWIVIGTDCIDKMYIKLPYDHDHDNPTIYESTKTIISKDAINPHYHMRTVPTLQYDSRCYKSTPLSTKDPLKLYNDVTKVL